MTDLMYWAGLITAGLVMLYFTVDIMMWTVYWMANLV